MERSFTYFPPPEGPQPHTRGERRALLEHIVGQLRRFFGERLLALGVYGSIARQADGPYSDIELYAVLDGHDIDAAVEWVQGPWKAEINLLSPDGLRGWAAEFEGDWAQTHGSCVNIEVLTDPQRLFPEIRRLVFEHSEEEFRAAQREVITGDIYEIVGKMRNGMAGQRPAALPQLAVELARAGAWLLGLAQRHLYGSSSDLLPEALLLPDRPAGFDDLCRLVLSGRLDDPQRVMAAADRFWAGIEGWAAARQLVLTDRLEDLFGSVDF